MKKIITLFVLIFITVFVSAQCVDLKSVTKEPCCYGQERFKIVYRNATTHNQGLKIICPCFTECIKLKPTTKDTTIYTDCLYGCTTFSYVTYSNYINGCCSNPCTALPVTFIKFSGENKNNVTSLQWEVGIEGSVSDVFTVEKSTDGIRFNTVATIPLTTAMRYSYQDKNSLESEVAYYRVFIDHKYSQILRIFNKDGSVVFSPTQSMVQISRIPAGSKTQIVNVNEQVIKTFYERNVTIDISGYTAGMYMIKVFRRDGQNLYTKKFLKL